MIGVRFKFYFAMLIVVLAGIVLAGCASTPQTVYVSIPTVPDDTLLKDCNKTGKDWIVTNKDLGDGFNMRGDDIDACNADKAGLRTWKAGVIAAPSSGAVEVKK